MKYAQTFSADSKPVEGKFDCLKEAIYHTDGKSWECLPSGGKIFLSCTERENRVLSELLRKTGGHRPSVVIVSEAK